MVSSIFRVVGCGGVLTHPVSTELRNSVVSNVLKLVKKDILNMTFSTVMIEYLSYSEKTFQNGITCITNTNVLFVYYGVRTYLTTGYKGWLIGLLGKFFFSNQTLIINRNQHDHYSRSSVSG